MQLQFTSSVWWLVAAFLLAATCAGGLYYKNKKDELDRRWRIILFTVRFGFVFLICFLLMSPLIRIRREYIKKPVCYLAVDESFSMRSALNSLYRNPNLSDSGAFVPSNFSDRLEEEITKLSQRLSEHFRVRTLSFGQNVADGPAFSFDRPATDYGQLFTYIGQASASSENALTVLVSDGNRNIGKDPLSTYRNIAFPLYTVCIGDTTLYPDLFIEQALTNRYAYRGNLFPVRITVGQTRAADAHSHLRLLYNGKTLRDSIIRYNGKREQTIEWELEAGESGVHAYTLALDPLENERNTENNRRTFHIQVLENRQKILILGNAPHPDISCLRQSLAQQEKYQSDVVLAKDMDRLLRNPAEAGSYDLVILHGLPSLRYPLEKLKPFIERPPLFYILTPATLPTAFNRENTGIEIHPQGNRWNEVQAHVNPNFGLFRLPPEDIQLWASFPPLSTPFGRFSVSAGGDAVFLQSIMQIPTSDPLLWIGPQTNRRIAVWCGCHIWKWRMANYQERNNTEAFDLMIDKCIQLLCEAKPSDHLVIHCPSLIRNTENLLIGADLYNQAFEKVEQAEIRFGITHGKTGVEYAFVFLPTAIGGYELNAGFLPEGDYAYHAETRVGTETFTAKGHFRVADPRIENLQLPSNPDLLRNLALTYQGKFFYAGTPEHPNQTVWQDLFRDIAAREDLKPRIMRKESYLMLLNHAWIPGILLFLLCFEYFIRKRFGNL